jgi:hypothetical protein
MKSRKVVNFIRSGPATLDLWEPLTFRRQTRFNWRFNLCDFDKLLQALKSSKKIQHVFCGSHLLLGITEDEWVLLVKTLGRITDVKIITVECCAGSRHFRPFQAIADALENARSLHTLDIHLGGRTFPDPSSGLTALANVLREHKALRDFTWRDDVSRLQAAPVDLSPDLVLRALPACPQLWNVSIMTQCASAGAMKTLLQLPEDTSLALALKPEHWLAVADGSNSKYLSLVILQGQSSEGTEAVKAIACGIRLNRNLERLTLKILNSDFADEAAVALAEALTVNKGVRRITLDFLQPRSWAQDEDILSAPAYDAFSAMLRVNTRLVLDISPFGHPGGNQRLIDSRNQLRIEQRLNHVGRGRLQSSSQTTRKEWIDALNELNSFKIDKFLEFNVSCLYSLLRLNPATCM